MSRHRAAFGKTLIDQPLMLRVLSDMALDLAAALALSLRLAEAFDMAEEQPAEAAYARLMTPGGQILGLQDARRPSSTRRWSASAATATSRRARCRGSIARRRSTPSGRAPATSWRSTWCGR